MSKPVLLTVMTLLLMAASAASRAAGDGEALYQSAGCTACHGARGERTPMPGTPALAGRDQSDLLQAMKEIRDGNRTGGMSAAMRPGLQGMSEAELEAVSEWLGGSK